MASLLSEFNSNQKIYLYWIFIYSYKSNQIPKEFIENNLYLFSFSYYTLYNNRALWVFISDRQLDLNNDDDLDIILKKYKLSNVKSLSELNINSNTNIICLEIDHKKYKKFKQHNFLLFYSSKNLPFYIENKQLNESFGIPQNKQLMSKLKIHIDHLGQITTKITLNKVFRFLFQDLFESIIISETKLVDFEKDRDRMFNDYIKRSNETFNQLLESIKQSELEDSNNDLSDNSEDDGYDTDDSHLSWYSYCKKYGVPTKEKTIE